MVKYVLVPPDGGYGWVIVCASALNNFVVVPLIQSFGLIFKDTFLALGLSATQGSLIINMNASFGMLIGLINGPLLNHYGYRKISFLAGFLLFFGVVLTSISNSFWGFLVTYGLISSLGFGLGMSSYSLAINTYFKKRKSRAIGISMTITGLGPIIMPQIINFLMQTQAISGVTLILGAICGHSFIAASLLQPVKWHMKKEIVEEAEPLNEETIEEEGDDQMSDEVLQENPRKFGRSVSQVEYGSLQPRKNSMAASKLSIDYEIEGAGILGMDSNLGASVISLESIGLGTRRRQSISRRPSMSSNAKTKTQWWKSASTVNLDSSVNIFDEKTKKQNLENAISNKPDGAAVNNTTRTSQVESVYNPELSVKKEKEEKALWKRIFLRLAILFDLNLLKDPIYCNIMLGMSLAIFAELNFSVLTAFILDDLGLTTPQIATFMSILGIADITFRFFAPYIGEYLDKPPRIMYMLTLLALITTRFGLIITSEYKFLLGVAVVLGIAKGVRTVYMSLVIPTYVPLERLAAASGIQMMVNGMCILIGGPILGVVRDITGSYRMCIVIMNAVTFTTICMWTVEMIYIRMKNKKKVQQINEQENELIAKS